MKFDDIEIIESENSEFYISGNKLVIKIPSEKLRESLRELLIEEKFKGMVEMASFLSHEIKNPIMALKSKIELLFEENSEDERLKTLKSIRSILQKIETIISNINIFVRGNTAELKPINVEAVLEETLREICEIKEIFPFQFDIQKSYSSDSLFVRGDFFLLKRAFSNIIVNGIESLENSEEKKIYIRTYDTKDFIVCEFEDTGCGIPQEKMQKIFIPFFTTKRQGTGLGMSVVKKVIELHGGEIEVESHEGKGTKVRLFFPKI